MRRSIPVMALCFVLCASWCCGQERQKQGAPKYPPTLSGATVEVYRTVGDVKLNIYEFFPPGHKPQDKRPAVVFFFGGGWRSGTPGQFEHQCRYLASRGMVAMTADYRVQSRHDVQVADCVKDAQAAVRWVRAHAGRLGVDPNRIAAGGGSAGGHLAACTATLAELEKPGDATQLSSRPNALVLFNPVAALAAFDGSPPADQELLKGLKERIGADPRSLSPAHHVTRGVPPTILFFGTQDRLLSGAEFFQKQMKQAGNRCELVTYEGQQHGFFNFGRAEGNKFFRDTVERADRFLVSLGYVAGDPTIDEYLKSLGK